MFSRRIMGKSNSRSGKKYHSTLLVIGMLAIGCLLNCATTNEVVQCSTELALDHANDCTILLRLNRDAQSISVNNSCITMAEIAGRNYMICLSGDVVFGRESHGASQKIIRGEFSDEVAASIVARVIDRLEGYADCESRNYGSNSVPGERSYSLTYCNDRCSPDGSREITIAWGELDANHNYLRSVFDFALDQIHREHERAISTAKSNQ